MGFLGVFVSIKILYVYILKVMLVGNILQQQKYYKCTNIHNMKISDFNGMFFNEITPINLYGKFLMYVFLFHF